MLGLALFLLSLILPGHGADAKTSDIALRELPAGVCVALRLRCESLRLRAIDVNLHALQDVMHVFGSSSPASLTVAGYVQVVLSGYGRRLQQL